LPARTSLGPDFAKVWTASAVSNVGDGVTMIAGPLLVAQLTGDPGLVAGAAFVHQLPWLLFALVSGAYVDRLDRRRLVIVVNLGRSAALAALATAVATDSVTIPLVYAVFFLLGTGETLVDTAYAAIVPRLVPDAQLERANARLMATFVVGNQLAAKPLGAYLFVAGAAVPFGFDAMTFLVAAALLAAVRWRPQPRDPAAGARDSLRTDIAEGLRALWERPPIRLLAICLCVMNVLFCAAFATFVLYAQRRLGLDEIGFGTLLSVWALGGLAGAWLAPRLRDRIGPGVLLRAGLVIETATELVLAVTRSPVVAAATLVVFGVHAMVWGVITASLQQRLVPDRLRGRVGSVFGLLALGGAALGTLAGGLVADATTLTAPFWLAAVGMVALTATVWRRLTDAVLSPPQQPAPTP
jgi:MFS family permease